MLDLSIYIEKKKNKKKENEITKTHDEIYNNI